MAKKVLFGMLAVLLAFGLVISCAEPFIDFSEVDGVPKTAKPDAPPRVNSAWDALNGSWRLDWDGTNVRNTLTLKADPYTNTRGTFVYELGNVNVSDTVAISNARFGLKSFEGVWYINNLNNKPEPSTTITQGQIESFIVTKVNLLIGATPVSIKTRNAEEVAADQLKLSRLWTNLGRVIGLFYEGTTQLDTTDIMQANDLSYSVPAIYQNTINFVPEKDPVAGLEPYEISLDLTRAEAIATIEGLIDDIYKLNNKLVQSTLSYNLWEEFVDADVISALVWKEFGAIFEAAFPKVWDVYMDTVILATWVAAPMSLGLTAPAALSDADRTAWKNRYMEVLYDAAVLDPGFNVPRFTRQAWYLDGRADVPYTWQEFYNWYFTITPTTGVYSAYDSTFNVANQTAFQFFGASRPAYSTTAIQINKFGSVAWLNYVDQIIRGGITYAYTGGTPSAPTATTALEAAYGNLNYTNRGARNLTNTDTDLFSNAPGTPAPLAQGGESTGLNDFVMDMYGLLIGGTLDDGSGSAQVPVATTRVPGILANPDVGKRFRFNSTATQTLRIYSQNTVGLLGPWSLGNIPVDALANVYERVAQ